MRFEVFVDGRKVIDETVLDATMGLPITVDVHGASILTIKVALVGILDDANTADTTIVWGDACLTPA